MRPLFLGARTFSCSVHPASLLGLFLTVLFNDAPTLLVLFSCVLTHEAGHFFTALCQRRTLCGLHLRAGGIELQLEEGNFSYGADALLHLSGPLANLAAAVGCILLIRQSADSLRFFAFYFHLCLFFFHLLPLSGLDGGRALFCLLSFFRDPFWAQKRLFFIERLCAAVAVSVLLLLLFYSGFHVSLFVGVLFFLGTLLEKQKVPAV